jgi:hypothetical protein
MASADGDFLLGFVFDPEERDNMSLENFGLPPH